ncbi:MAG: hypothetical protein JSS81_28395, partial [Acidobacteria bacterium]|nr:hypothetical protein [Acidobacteriota bacterium]
IPPLRERGGDAMVLAHWFLTRYAREFGRRLRGFDPGATRAIETHAWPGNVRELENAIERAVVLGAGEWILPEDLADDFLDAAPPAETGEASNYHDALRAKKIELIRGAFREARGSYTEAARLLQVHPNYLHRLIRNLEIKELLEREG